MARKSQPSFLKSSTPHIEMASSVAMWEDQLTQIMITTIRTRVDEQREEKATKPPRDRRRQDVKKAWEFTKNSAFFGRAMFPPSVIMRIDAQIDLHRQPGNVQAHHVPPAVASVREWKLDDYADCVVEMLMTLHLGAALQPFQIRKVSEHSGMDSSRLGKCLWRCIALRDIVAHANGILTIRPYPRKWTTMPRASSPSTLELSNLMVAGEKRKALVLDTDLTPQQVAARKHPRVSMTSTSTAVEQETRDKSEVHGTSTQMNTTPPGITISAATMQKYDKRDELRSKAITDNSSIIQKLKLRSASLVSSIGPQPTIQDLIDRLKPLDADLTAEDWVSQLAIQYACNKMEARFHQLLKNHHSEQIQLIKDFEQSFIDGITRMAETRQDHDLTTELAGL
ncbi:hypothetical protein B0T11DRAFT_297500 [Plectosphaerella cucumerina]|uniref:Uncharacterized protein n=1 Tax=Plectosphaerella cucumerina TaxID=40658 RepID=A0A8K0TID1_9PEZI|nr:hypothetical protein B0T11DRAFT_297500 [Plectosphaerella cucumerina]